MKAPTKQKFTGYVSAEQDAIIETAISDQGQPTGGAESAPEAQAVAASSQPVPFEIRRVERLCDANKTRQSDNKICDYCVQIQDFVEAIWFWNRDVKDQSVYTLSVRSRKNTSAMETARIGCMLAEMKLVTQEKLRDGTIPTPAEIIRIQEQQAKVAAKERLEAAASELLEALQALVATSVDRAPAWHSECQPLLEKARAAILKATQPA